MGDKRTKQRITSKIDELPEDLRMKVDVMLADTSNTYEYISQDTIKRLPVKYSRNNQKNCAVASMRLMKQ